MDMLKRQRELMVDKQISLRGINDPRVLAAFRKVEREKFVPQELVEKAYDDQALSIGLEQTISQPYVVAYMTDALQIKSTDSVLEIGTGSGYQTAILAELASTVFTVERLEWLAQSARNLLSNLGYQNINFKVGDGHKGWIEKAPFDKIILTAAPQLIPRELVDQLAVGGRLIGPWGSRFEQRLILLEKTAHGTEKSDLFPVRFVPMIEG